MSLPLRSLLAAALALGAAGCDVRRESAPAASPEVATYDVRGVLHEVRGEGRRAVIAHEEIPGYMEAMTMEFTAAEAADLAGLGRGDVLEFRLSVGERRSWIDRVRKTGRTEIAPASDDPALPTVGRLPPDVPLLDERGRALRLGDFRGRALAITFIYTRCPLPDYCPLLAARFAEVQRALGASEGWHLLSISIDPEHDTPERLRAYSARLGADPARWSFSTGESAEIGKLAGFFGLATVRAGAEWNHNLRTAVLDGAGRVQRVLLGNQWTAEELTAELQRAMPGRR
jgi:protein SCO1/2